MDVKRTFRNLVTNKYMQNFNYESHKFSFKTLFHQSSYSYCCCSCGFKHEYIDYISEDGAINEDMYQKILQCISDGKCPHVDKAPRDTFVRKAKIYSMHVAAAVGTINAVESIQGGYRFKMEGGIYCLDLVQIVVLKKQCCFAKRILDHMKENSRRVIHTLYNKMLSFAARSCHDNKSITFEKITIPKFCIRTTNLSLLKVTLHPMIFYPGVYEDLNLIYDEELTDMHEELIAYFRAVRHNTYADILTKCAISAILHEQNHDLKAIFDTIKSRPLPYFSKLTKQLPRICEIFGKHHQKVILESFDYCFGPVGMHYNTIMLHHLIKNYADGYERELKDAYQTHENNEDDVNTYSLLHYCIADSLYDVDPRHAEVLIKLGASVDVVKSFSTSTRKYEKTALQSLLQKVGIMNLRNFRSVLVLFIFENPDRDINLTAVHEGIDFDENFQIAINANMEIAGNYAMDATEHTHFLDDEFALNFIGPLLIECGFYCSRNTLLNAQERRLHQAELEYFNYFLNNPRSLKLSCRDVLRRHFKRRAIYDFVNNSVIPEKIKDYILIKRVLTQSRTFH